jgi:hypothetical protein
VLEGGYNRLGDDYSGIVSLEMRIILHGKSVHVPVRREVVKMRRVGEKGEQVCLFCNVSSYSTWYSHPLSCRCLNECVEGPLNNVRKKINVRRVLLRFFMHNIKERKDLTKSCCGILQASLSEHQCCATAQKERRHPGTVRYETTHEHSKEGFPHVRMAYSTYT